MPPDGLRQKRVRFDEALFKVPATAALRLAAAGILEQAVAAVDPYAATLRVAARTDEGLQIRGRTYALRAGARAIVVGAGKAGAPMARAVEEILGDRLAAGLVTVKTGYTAPLARIVLREANHPLPDAAGIAAAQEMLALLTDLGPDDLVICLISGGGSALLPLPRSGLTLDDMVETMHAAPGIGGIALVGWAAKSGVAAPTLTWSEVLIWP